MNSTRSRSKCGTCKIGQAVKEIRKAVESGKRSVFIDGRKTSVSLEDEFWEGLKKIDADRGLAISEVIQWIDDARTLRSYQQLSSWATLPST